MNKILKLILPLMMLMAVSCTTEVPEVTKTLRYPTIQEAEIIDKTASTLDTYFHSGSNQKLPFKNGGVILDDLKYTYTESITNEIIINIDATIKYKNNTHLISSSILASEHSTQILKLILDGQPIDLIQYQLIKLLKDALKTNYSNNWPYECSNGITVNKPISQDETFKAYYFTYQGVAHRASVLIKENYDEIWSLDENTLYTMSFM